LQHEADADGISRVFIDMVAAIDVAAANGLQQQADGSTAYSPAAE
jgi:hypothetical protein